MILTPTLEKLSQKEMINYPDARVKAQSILKMYHMDTPPIDVEKIAKLLGFEIVYHDFPDKFSGVTKIIEGQKFIGINKKHHKVRQRFSIAHEIGHFLNGHDNYISEGAMVEPEMKYKDPRFQQEKEADEFAAELLMPEFMLKIDILEKRLKAEDLAEKYQVSEQAMWVQLISLHLVPGEEFNSEDNDASDEDDDFQTI